MRFVFILTVSAGLAAAQVSGAEEVSQQRADMLAFLRANGVQACVGEDNLQSNPFPYKGSKVALLGRWNQLLSESEAVFSDMYVNNVPSKYVMVNSRALLVAGVIGKSDMSIGGQIKATGLNYIAAKNISPDYWNKMTEDGSDSQVVQDFFWSCDTYFGQ